MTNRNIELQKHVISTFGKKFCDLQVQKNSLFLIVPICIWKRGTVTNPTVSRQSAELYKTLESLKSLTYLLRIKWVFQVVDLFLYLSQFRS